MTATSSTVEVDGRTLDLLLGGDEQGFPLVLHHGTPSDATLFRDWDGDCAGRGLRLVAVSRPGYASSTRLPGRDVAQVAGDTAAVLDLLGHRDFVTAGWSGGGPHALACAAVLSERCRGAATLAGVGPAGARDLEFTAGMAQENIEEFGAAEAGEDALRRWMDANGASMQQVTADEISEALGGLVPQVDKDALAAGFAGVMADEVRRALARGLDGWIDDDLAFLRPWGFDLASITAPVSIWQGELDLMVPAAHAPWLAAHISGARLMAVPGHGHISLVQTYRGTVLDELGRAAS